MESQIRETSEEIVVLRDRVEVKDREIDRLRTVQNRLKDVEDRLETHENQERELESTSKDL